MLYLFTAESLSPTLYSGALHELFSVNWCEQNGLKHEQGKWFSVLLADGQEVSAVGKLRCLVYLGPIKTVLTFHVLYCNVPCILGLLVLQMDNSIIDWEPYCPGVHGIRFLPFRSN